MKAIALLACAIMPLAHAALRPSFLLNRCAWEATEVLELAIAPGESHFRPILFCASMPLRGVGETSLLGRLIAAKEAELRGQT